MEYLNNFVNIIAIILTIIWAWIPINISIRNGKFSNLKDTNRYTIVKIINVTVIKKLNINLEVR